MTEHLAIIYPKAIGDFMFILPALHSIRKALPTTRITLVVKKKQAPLAMPQEGTLADHVICLGGNTTWLDVRRELARTGVDTCIDMVGNDHSGLILAFRGGRRIRPHRTDCKGMCQLYTLFAESLPPLKPGLHRVEELLQFASHIGVTNPVYSFRLVLPDQAIEASQTVIDRYQLKSGTVVALNLGASRDSKRWPARYFRELAEALVSREYRVLIMGARNFTSDGNHDRNASEQFFQDEFVDGENCINLITEGDLPPALQLQRDTHILRYSGVPEVVVGNDTGMMHIAGSVGDDASVKTVSLFGPTNWGRYAPYDPSRQYPNRPAGDWNQVLCIDHHCTPSGLKEACSKYRRGCPTVECMKGLPPETVLNAITATIDRSTTSTLHGSANK